MTDPLTVGVASAAAGLSAVIGWLLWPREPALDGERLFKAALATLLRGQVEAAGGDADAWAAAVRVQVPYHPAGRQPERKVGAPEAGLPSPALEGERALVEKLAALPDAPARWAWMYDQDEAGPAVLLDDPAQLGPAHDPAGALGPAHGWEALAAWGAGAPEGQGFAQALARHSPATWVLVAGRPTQAPDVLGALARWLPDTVQVPWTGLDPAPATQALGARAADPAARFVWVGAEAGVQVILRALAADAGLRDRTLAVVSVGGLLGGRPEDPGPLGELALADWMGAWFDHHKLDTEFARRTPYMALQWLDRTAQPPGAFGLALAQARFPEPRLESMTVETVQPVDLGVLPPQSDPDLVARGLWVTVVRWVRASG